MQGPDQHLPSTQVAEEFAKQTKKLQCSRKLMARHMVGNYEGDVFGGYVRSYGFNYNPKSDMAEGKMWIYFAGEEHIECDVTVVILGGDKKDAETALKIVQKTSKLAEVSDLVLDAYFCTFAESIGRHVVVYERIVGPFFGSNEQLIEPFFMDREVINNCPARKFRLTPFWVHKMRSFIDLLDYGSRRKVTHGGLNNLGSYVVSSETVKLINVGRYVGREYIAGKDLIDLRSMINSRPFFGGYSSNEWATFDRLLGSHLVTNFGDGWKKAVVGHPILQDSADSVISTFDGVHKAVEEIGSIGATKLANLLFHDFPSFKRIVDERDAKTPSERKKALKTFFPLHECHVLRQLFSFVFPGSGGTAYGGKIIYLEVINLSRNFIHHAWDYDKSLDTAEAMLRKMRDYFSHYISAAYSLLHMLDDDPTKTVGPYTCPFQIERKPKPTTSFSLGSLLAKAKHTNAKKIP